MFPLRKMLLNLSRAIVPWLGSVLAVVVLSAGCGGSTSTTPKAAKSKPPVKRNPTVTQAGREEKKGTAIAPAGDKKVGPDPPIEIAASPPEDRLPSKQEGTLEDLVQQARANEFELPEIDEAKVAAAGIRKLSGKHITIFTDLPEAPDVEELPHVFDRALPEWRRYFEFDQAKTADWKIVGYLMKDKERFAGTALLPDNLPPFINGYQRGSEIWWYDQPSPFYRRHLMLHEGTHAFMNRFLGGAGPPWYMEGIAEFLGTHRWDKGQLTLGYNPGSKEEAPYWGRVKLIREEYAASRGMLLTDIMKYDAHAHLKNEPYAWCWGAAMFFDSHPLTRKAFRDLRLEAGDRSIDFSRRFQESLKDNWPQVIEDWQLFIVNCDYGYDVARSAVVRQNEVRPVPAAGAEVSITADRGWQSTGLKLEAGKKYSLAAAGRYHIAKLPQLWECEPGGITIHYHQGKPLGMALAAVGDLAESGEGLTPLARPLIVGLAGEITPAASGMLYLCINEASSGLDDNQGSLTVRVAPKK